MKTKAQGERSALSLGEMLWTTVQGILTNTLRNFTVPSDDANFDPPKFAGWAGMPQTFTLYGISSLFFVVTGAFLLGLAAWSPEEGGTFGTLCPTRFEGTLYIMVGITSLHGDVLRMGQKSYWHIADRILAQMLIVANVRQALALFTVSLSLGLTAVVAVTLPLASYANSYWARVYVPYKACHTLWHFTAATNRAVIAVVAFAFTEGTGFTEQQAEHLHTASRYYLACEAVLCAGVWGYSWQLHAKCLKEGLAAEGGQPLLEKRGAPSNGVPARRASPTVSSLSPPEAPQ